MAIVVSLPRKNRAYRASAGSSAARYAWVKAVGKNSLDAMRVVLRVAESWLGIHRLVLLLNRRFFKQMRFSTKKVKPI